MHGGHPWPSLPADKVASSPEAIVPREPRLPRLPRLPPSRRPRPRPSEPPCNSGSNNSSAANQEWPATVSAGGQRRGRLCTIRPELTWMARSAETTTIHRSFTLSHAQPPSRRLQYKCTPGHTYAMLSPSVAWRISAWSSACAPSRSRRSSRTSRASSPCEMRSTASARRQLCTAAESCSVCACSVGLS